MAQKDIVKKYQTHAGDTGSTQVQVALLSERITELTDHLKEHKKDFDSQNFTDISEAYCWVFGLAIKLANNISSKPFLFSRNLLK